MVIIQIISKKKYYKAIASKFETIKSIKIQLLIDIYRAHTAINTMSAFFLPRFRAKNNLFKLNNDKSSSNKRSIAIIKEIGDRHNEETRHVDTKRMKQLTIDMKTVVSLMKRNRKDRHLQRVACHTISNMAIHQEKCAIICAANGHRSVIRSVMDIMGDWKMCWLGMSAIWNLARPECCRKQFHPSTLKLIYKVISKHNAVHLVIETALGALSNLVLCEKIRVQCGKFHILQFLVEIIRQHVKHCNVTTASAGLVTNLAHSNEIASRLCEIGTIGLIISIMSHHSHDTHLQRNCCAALSNMSSASGYVHNLVECLGIERIFASLNLAALNPTSQIEPLAEQALIVIDIDWTKIRMSSLHIAAKQGLYLSVYKCLSLMMKQQNGDNNKYYNINVQDSNGNSALHYAIEHQHENVTKLLVSRGSDVGIENKNGVKPMDLINGNDGMRDAVDTGLRLLKNARLCLNKMLCGIKIKYDDEENIIIPVEIGMLLIEYIEPFEVMDYYGNDDLSVKNLNKDCRLTSYYVMDDQELKECI